MNQFLRGVARATVESFDLPDPVLEIGSYQVEGQEDLIDLRGLFADRPYTGVDFRAGPGVDLVANVENLPLPDASVGTVVAFSVFEHVKQFWKGFDEVHRVLRPDGVFLVCCPFYFHVHAYPHDYWRFTPEAFDSLLERVPDAHARLARPGAPAAERVGRRVPRGGEGADRGAVQRRTARSSASTRRSRSAGVVAAFRLGPRAVRPAAVRPAPRPREVENRSAEGRVTRLLDVEMRLRVLPILSMITVGSCPEGCSGNRLGSRVRTCLARMVKSTGYPDCPAVTKTPNFDVASDALTAGMMVTYSGIKSGS